MRYLPKHVGTIMLWLKTEYKELVMIVGQLDILYIYNSLIFSLFKDIDSSY